MISPSFNLREFIEAVQDKDCLEIISLAQQEVQMAEQRSFSVKGAVKNRNDGSTRYAADLWSKAYGCWHCSFLDHM